MKLTHSYTRAAAWIALTAALTLVVGATARAADLEIGQPAPDFSLPDENGRVHNLAEYRGKILILAFYPKDFTGG